MKRTRSTIPASGLSAAPLAVVLAVAAWCPAGAAAQDNASVDVIWEAEAVLSGSAVGNAVLELPGGDVVCAGYYVTRDSAHQAALMRVAPDGEIRWVRSYGGVGDDFLWDVEPTPDGGFLAVGFTGPDRGVDVWLLRTDGEGAVVWERRYGGTGRDRAWSLASDGAGGWYVAGERTPETGGDEDAWLLRLRADGDTVWTRVLGGPEVQRVFSVATLPGGDAVVTGGTGSNDRRSGDNDILVARYSRDGFLYWRSAFGDDRYDVGHGVLPAEDGVLITGYGTPPGNPNNDTDLLLMRMNPHGGVLWREVRSGRGHERAMMSAPAPGGGWVTVGFGVAVDVDLRLWGTEPDGRRAWRWTRLMPGIDRGVMVQPTTDGSYVLTGAIGHSTGDVAPLRVIKLRVEVSLSDGSIP